jgi:uncharacterized membrane protein
MKFSKDRIFLVLSVIYIVITGGINLFGFFHLPDEVATHFSFTGEQVNRMPKEIYLLIGFIVVLILALFSSTKGQQKLKYLLVNSIIVIANIVMIMSQL